MTHPIRIVNPIFYVNGEKDDGLKEVLIDRSDIKYVERESDYARVFIESIDDCEQYTVYQITKENYEYMIRQIQSYLYEG